MAGQYQALPSRDPAEPQPRPPPPLRARRPSLLLVTLLALVVFILLSLASSRTFGAPAASEDASCPDYGSYAASPHEPRSRGELGLPSMRPPEQCRTFSSPAVERIVAALAPRFEDPNLGMLFTNAFTQTLDTTIRWTGDGLTFIVTGDINAEWIRDTYNQIDPYINLLSEDAALAKLVRGIIALQARYLARYPFCNSFQAPAESGISPVHNGAADGAVVEPPYDNSTVFECKFELDSHASFLALSRRYAEAVNDTSFLSPTETTWVSAVSRILVALEAEGASTFDANGYIQSAYNFSSSLDVVINGGVGPPQKATGMVGTSFRPSDDKVAFRFNIPDNAMLAVELERAVPLLQSVGGDLASRAATLARGIRSGIAQHGVVTHPVWGTVFAYEVDGYGSYSLMDDANNPSLLSLPLLGFTNISDEPYASTRKMILSVDGNPYYNRGQYGAAIGSPHTGIGHVWPMSLVTQMLTTDDDDEILQCLQTLTSTTSGLGLIHESFNVHNSSSYTRAWFAWANSWFAHGILDLCSSRPSLVLTEH